MEIEQQPRKGYATADLKRAFKLGAELADEFDGDIVISNMNATPSSGRSRKVEVHFHIK